MKCENAYKGIHKLFTSESLYIISTMLSFGASIVMQQNEGASMTDENYLLMTSLGLLLAAGVISLIALVIRLIGLNQARRDESQFKPALQFVIVGMVTTAISMFTAGTFRDIFSGIAAVANLLVSVYTILGVYCLAYRLDNKKVQTSGKIVMFVAAAFFTFAVISRMISIFTPVLNDSLDIVSYALDFIGHLAFIIYLSQAKVMLTETTA